MTTGRINQIAAASKKRKFSANRELTIEPRAQHMDSSDGKLAGTRAGKQPTESPTPHSHNKTLGDASKRRAETEDQTGAIRVKTVNIIQVTDPDSASRHQVPGNAVQT
jgi:hypothetical protein